jgi:hypothetical protein
VLSIAAPDFLTNQYTAEIAGGIAVSFFAESTTNVA